MLRAGKNEMDNQDKNKDPDEEAQTPDQHRPPLVPDKTHSLVYVCRGKQIGQSVQGTCDEIRGTHNNTCGGFTRWGCGE